MSQENLKIALAMLMTAVLTCTGTYVAMNNGNNAYEHGIIPSGYPKLNLGNYMVADIFDGTSPTQDSELCGFDSFEILKSFLTEHAETQDRYDYGLNGVDASESAVSMAGMGSSEGYHTNIQVAGVDEGDIVKNDGKYAYVISATGESVFIIQAYPAESARILSEIESAGTFVGLYIQEDRLIMLEQVYYFEGGYQRSNYMYSSSPLINIKVFDIANRSSPVLDNEAVLGGNYLTSRLIDSTLYVIGNQYILQWENESQLPVPLESLYFIESGEDEAYAITSFLTIDIEEAGSVPSIMGIVMASSNNIYVSTDNLYITHMKSQPDTGLLDGAENVYVEKTVIHRIGIQGQDLKYKARGEVPGRVLNRYSMDEYNGNFRIATTKGWSWSSGEGQSKNIVSVLDMALETTGILDNIAPGEQVYSARFMGAKCYLVTFRQVDPFFVIDLHDANNPEILGELKIPGYSSYLHPYDENHIIGLGKNGSLIKLALFNVTDVKNPTELDSVTVGSSYSDSPALDDPHAFMFSREKNLLVIPITGYDYNRERSTSGAYVFDISPENGITQKGHVDHETGNPDEYDYYGYNYYSSNQVKRSFIIEDVLYTVSDTMMKANAIDGLGELAVVELK
jgi:inhibitor of cysteine peptidase